MTEQKIELKRQGEMTIIIVDNNAGMQYSVPAEKGRYIVDTVSKSVSKISQGYIEIFYHYPMLL